MLRRRRTYGRSCKSSSRYSLYHHKAVLLLTAVFWIGILIGFVAYYWTEHSNADFLQSIRMARNSAASELTFRDWMAGSYGWFLMLFFLFLSGMCAFGYPMICSALFCSGVRIGIDQCCYYQWYGFPISLCIMTLPAILFGAAVIGLGLQGIRLTASVSKGLIGHHETGVRSSRLFGFTLAWLAIGLMLVGVGALLQMLIETALGIE